MLKVLLRKQLMEVFKGYFYDAKKNKMRSKAGIAAWIIFFIVIMAGVLGGIFTYLSVSLCSGLNEAGMGWLYFTLMSGIAILLGAFGSIFNTFSGLYLSKDNDLLLSMPVPVKYIIASRLLNVYLLGLMYSAVVIVPALIVYWITAACTAADIICGIILVLIISLFVLILSCLLGWCVAKISLKLKNKSFISVLAAVAFIAAYYFVYFRASIIINTLVANAASYGAKIKGSAYLLYLFGRVGEGSLPAAAVYLAACLLLLAATWLILKNTFLSIATASVNNSVGSAKIKPVKQKGIFAALLSKELSKFTSSPNYMLNCGLGILIIPIAGILLLIKGPALFAQIESVFNDIGGAFPESVPVLLCAALCMISSMNDMATPAVSLEGKSIWIPQSFPVEAKTVLRAKTAMHLILTAVPVAFTVLCAIAVMHASVGVKLLILLVSLMFVLFSSLFSSVLGICMPNINWTNEIVPIKQSLAVLIAIFGCWAVVVVFAGLYFLFGSGIGVPAYLGISAGVFALVSLFLFCWLDTKGAGRFADL